MACPPAGAPKSPSGIPPHYFVDVQLHGPYTLWHHTHTFEERDGGTLCLDEVRYRPRGGALVNWLFVRRDVGQGKVAEFTPEEAFYPCAPRQREASLDEQWERVKHLPLIEI